MKMKSTAVWSIVAYVIQIILLVTSIFLFKSSGVGATGEINRMEEAACMIFSIFTMIAFVITFVICLAEGCPKTIYNEVRRMSKFKKMQREDYVAQCKRWY